MSLDDQLTNGDAISKAAHAEGLRGQAAACRRLSSKARTRAGVKALIELGNHFDEQARKLDPSSMKR